MVMVVIVFSKLQISQAFRLSISIRPSCARSSACSQAALESPRRWFALLLLLHRTRSRRRKAILAQETAQYSGKWGGRAQIAGRGTCTFSLEIKTQPNTAKPFCRILQPSLHRHHFSRWYEDGPCGHSHPDRGKGGTIIDPALRQRNQWLYCLSDG